MCPVAMQLTLKPLMIVSCYLVLHAGETLSLMTVFKEVICYKSMQLSAELNQT